MYGDADHPKLHGTVVVRATVADGYSLTVTINGLDPNSLHNVHELAGTCKDQVADYVVSIDDVTADADGTLKSFTRWPDVFSIPTTGRILIVHDTTGRPHAHIGCSDLTN